MDKARRLFINRLAVFTGVAALSRPFTVAGMATKKPNAVLGPGAVVSIYYTNGLHGNINAVYKGFGGLQHIKTTLGGEKLRGLVLDAGGFMPAEKSLAEQKRMISLMNAAGYHAAALTNQELLTGPEPLASLIPMMQFSLINCNHRFNTRLKSLVKPYLVFKDGGIKIGITAVCAPIKGAAYKNAIECANRTARFLKDDERCHLVICLSDLGFDGENELNDQNLAEASEHIDMIIGNDRGGLGRNNVVLHNKLKREVIFSAAMSKGLTIGKTVVNFNDEKLKNGISIEHIMPWKPAGQKYAAALRELSLAGNPLPA